MKIKCYDCLRTLDSKKFFRDTKSKTGRQGRCKECQQADMKKRRRERRLMGLPSHETHSYRRMRYAALARYSGSSETPRCVCCGEAHIEFLCIDHEHGGGHKHRMRLGGSPTRSVYRDLQMKGYPPGYRTLCLNCNQSYGLYGHCPHRDPAATTERWLGKADGPLAVRRAQFLRAQKKKRRP